MLPEQRVVLKNCGVINPDLIDTYLNVDGFSALSKARSVSPDDVIQQIKDSGLRGRGGAGFPCGLKWDLAKNAPGNEKYVICNADEGEVGTFKDRYILTNDPFSLIEGIIIAGYAIGAERAFIYLRAEYHYLYDRLAKAIDQAREKGFPGNLNITIREGAGAYVCGEESALMDSIEGKRGEVRYRPPFPPTEGLWRQPTIINNVETLMNIPRIILNGADWFNGMGTERSKGTKVFSVSGDVGKPGVYEIVLGSRIRELVEDIAGAEKVKAIQIGGATGRIITGEMMDTPLSFETLLGAGAVTVFNENRDILDIIHKTMEFLAEESCGKCTPCREGTEVMAEVMKRFTRYEGNLQDITAMERLSRAMMLAAMCGLGQAAPNPVLDSLQHFRADYEKRIQGKQGGVAR